MFVCYAMQQQLSLTKEGGGRERERERERERGRGVEEGKEEGGYF